MRPLVSSHILLEFICPVIWGALLSLLAGCTLVPNPEAPETVEVIRDMPAYSAGEGVDRMKPAGGLAWWEGIGGSELAAMVSQLREGNFELREARERVLQARELARQARSRRLPAAAANIGVAENRTSNLQGDFLWSDNYSAGIHASFETDIFGGLRSAEKSARLSAKVTELGYLAREQQSVAFLTRSWLMASTLKRRLAVTREIVRNYRSTYVLTDERHRAGSAGSSASDVLIARQNLEAFAAEIPNLEAQIAVQLLAIDQQLGLVPGSTAKTFQGNLDVDETMVAPFGLPASLLTSRPDVAAAELAWHAALADIGVARANMLPVISLTSSLSFQSMDVSELFDPRDYIASLAASLAQPVTQGGRLRAQLRLEESQARELATAFARVALSALSEVETALAQQAGALLELEGLNRAVETAREASGIAQIRYGQGLQPLLSILETQRGLNNALQNRILAQQRLLDSRIALHLSLGGAWFETAQSFEAVPPEDSAPHSPNSNP